MPFVIPLLAGTVRAETQILRPGKFATLPCEWLFNGDEIVTTLTGVCGLGCPTPINIEPTPASSLMWTLESFRDDCSLALDGFWRTETEVRDSGDGYWPESSLVLDPGGKPFAFSRQLVAGFG
jgi:hypothetical protein